MDTKDLQIRLRRAEQYKPMLDRAQRLALDLSLLLDKRDEELKHINRSKNIVHLTPLIIDKERKDIRLEIFEKVKKLVRLWKHDPNKLEVVLQNMIDYERTH